MSKRGDFRFRWTLLAPCALIAGSITRWSSYSPAANPPQGLQEIKCLHAADSWAETYNFAARLMNDIRQLSLKTNHAYHYQIQGQMAITGWSLCDFVVMSAGKIAIQKNHFDQ